MLSPSITRPDRVRDLITQLKAEGIGILLISHDIDNVFDLADRITVRFPKQARWHRQQVLRHQGRGSGDDHHGKKPEDVSREDIAELHGSPEATGT